MTEARALILTYAGMSAVTIAIGLALRVLDAGGMAWGLAIGLLSALGAFVLSLVVMRYTSPKDRRRR